MEEIDRCVICFRHLHPRRTHVDTCSERCYRALLERQRANLARDEGRGEG
jgi:hypothetical protein